MEMIGRTIQNFFLVIVLFITVFYIGDWLVRHRVIQQIVSFVLLMYAGFIGLLAIVSILYILLRGLLGIDLINLIFH